MINIAVMGYGTVGSGVVEVLNTNQESINKRAGKKINIKYVLDLRDFEGDPIQQKITHNVNDILEDPEIKVVVETMGGIEPAYTFVKTALQRGKSVCTSNKELVAKHGPELLELAKAKNINFLFEASVGGGIPIIRPLNQSLTADEIYEITGILNGTTNYILSKMMTEGLGYDTVLKEAQDLGYAEKNPAADVEGHDACRKIAILSSLAYGMHVDYEDIYTEGITKITKADMDYAKALDSDIKLIATSKKIDGQVYARVSPALLSKAHALATVHGVFNAIFVKGNVLGDVMFYGKGAGKLPTASAVVADVVDAVKHIDRNIMSIWSTQKLELMPIDEVPTQMFIRIAYQDFDAARKAVEAAFDTKSLIQLEAYPGEFAIITHQAPEKSLQQTLGTLATNPSITAIINTIRLEK